VFLEHFLNTNCPDSMLIIYRQCHVKYYTMLLNVSTCVHVFRTKLSFNTVTCIEIRTMQIPFGLTNPYTVLVRSINCSYVSIERFICHCLHLVCMFVFDECFFHHFWHNNTELRNHIIHNVFVLLELLFSTN